MNKTIIALIIAVLVIVVVIIGYLLISKPTSETRTSTQIITIAQHSVINLNLGTLYPNEYATIKTAKSITVNKGGNYSFKMVNQGVEKDFISFWLVMNLSNSTMNKMISLGWLSLPPEQNSSAYLMLSPGTYNLTLIVLYNVNESIIPLNFGDVEVDMGNISLVSVVFAIQKHPTIEQQMLSVKPIYLNITPKSSMPAFGSTTIKITNGGEYIFQVANVTELKKYFSSIGAAITISNSTEEIKTQVQFSTFYGFFEQNASVLLSPGTYKLHIALYYFYGFNVTPAEFNSTVIKINNIPLVNVNFIILPTVKAETGTIYANGTAVIPLWCNGYVEIVKAQIVGTNISVNTSYRLTAGIHKVIINFSFPYPIPPGAIYTIALTLSDGETIEVNVVSE